MTISSPRKARSWLLIGSLSLNLFLIGFLAVQAFHHGPGSNHWEERRSQGIWGMMRYMRGSEGGDRFLHRLSSQDRQVMETLKAQFGPSFEDAWNKRLEERNAIRDILQSETRDRDALVDAFEGMQENRENFSNLLHTVILEAYDNMSNDGISLLGEGGHGRHRD